MGLSSIGWALHRKQMLGSKVGIPSQSELLTLLSQLDLGCHCAGVCCACQLCFHSSTAWPAATTQWGHERGTYQSISARSTPKGRRAKPTVALACVGSVLHTWGTGGEHRYGMAWNNISKNTETVFQSLSMCSFSAEDT